MALALRPPLTPQLAKTAKSLPKGDGWSYEPKWDGFRALAFVDGDQVNLQSRNCKPLSRYFPELAFPEGRYVLDGEIVLFDAEGRQDFDALGTRQHPAESRVRKLAQEIPTRYIAFDLLAWEDEQLLDLAQEERRARLEAFAATWPEGGDGRCNLSPRTLDPAQAEPWLHSAEGVIAKRTDAPYRPGERVGMSKIKRVRTIDAVVIGWRAGKEPGTVGSMLLGLYDEDGRLREVGHTSGIKAREKKELVEKLKPYETGEIREGEPSRWSVGKDLRVHVLRPELVVEVSFDHTSNDRIRHGTTLLRWREDKDPRECLKEQLQQ